MSSIEYENQIDTSGNFERSKSGIRGLLFKIGLVKTERQADFVILGIILLGIIFISFFIYSKFHTNLVSLEEIKKFDQTQFTH